MNTYLGYLTDYERASVIESTKFDSDYNKLCLLYEVASLQFDNFKKEIKYKYLCESSNTYKDYYCMITEAEEQNTEKKKGIISRIIQAIKNFFNRLRGKGKDIRNSAIPEDQDVEVPGDLEEKYGKVMGTRNNIQNGVAKLQNGDLSGALDILKAAALPIGIVAITGNVIYKKIKKSQADKISNDMEETTGLLNKAIEKIQSLLPGMKDNKDTDKTKECLGPIQHIIKVANSILDALKSGVNKVLGKDNKKNEENAKKEENSRLLSNNGVLEKNDGKGGKYRIDRTTGSVVHIDPNGNEKDMDKSQLPNHILKISNQLKGKAAVKAVGDKKLKDKKDNIRNQFAKPVRFSKKDVGADVFVDPTNVSVNVNGNRINVTDTMMKDISNRDLKKLLKQSGVKSQYGKIIKAIKAANEGYNKAIKLGDKYSNEQIRKDHQLNNVPISTMDKSTFKESVCECMNEYLSDSFYEAVINGDYIQVIDIRKPAKLSNKLILSLENCGYTVFESPDFYIIE